MVDFVELSQESVNRYKESIGSNDYIEYRKTLYVAISECNEVSCAYDPVILRDAYQCILIHCRSEMAVSKWHAWYKAEFINHNGVNLEGIIGNDCHFNIYWVGSWSNQVLTLYHRDEEIYTCKPPFEGHMQGLWDAYCNTLKRGQDESVRLRAELTQKEERIHDLEEQLDHYKQMLNGIKDIIQELGV